MHACHGTDELKLWVEKKNCNKNTYSIPGTILIVWLSMVLFDSACAVPIKIKIKNEVDVQYTFGF